MSDSLPFRMQLDFVVAAESAHDVERAYMRLIQCGRELNLLFEGGYMERMDCGDVIDRSPLHRVLSKVDRSIGQAERVALRDMERLVGE